MTDVAASLPSKADFSAAVNTHFRAFAAEVEALEFVLISVDEIASNENQETYSLQFLAPVTAPRSQGIFKLEHETLGSMNLFLVPIKLDEKGLYYEAIFNYFLGI